MHSVAHVRLTSEEVKDSWKIGDYSAAGYLYHLFKALKREGWTFRIDDVKKFCEAWEISEASFYRAKAKLITQGRLTEKILGKIELKLTNKVVILNSESRTLNSENSTGLKHSPSNDFEVSPDLIQIYNRSNTDLININTENFGAFAPEESSSQPGKSARLDKTDFSEDSPESEPFEESAPETPIEPPEEPRSEPTDSAKKTRAKPKPKESDYAIFIDLYNAEKPPSWARCSSLNSERLRLLKRLVLEHGENTAVAFQEALKFVNRDRWWSKQSLGFTNFVRHVTDLAEKAEVCGATQEEADAKEFDRIYRALGGTYAETGAICS